MFIIPIYSLTTVTKIGWALDWFPEGSVAVIWRSCSELLGKSYVIQDEVKELLGDSLKNANTIDQKLKFIDKEYSILRDQLEKNVKSDKKLDRLYQSLKEINSKLWLIEDEKRLCEKEKDFGEKFIKLSRDVHFLNDDRAKIKLEINNHTGSKIKEIKEYTKY